MPRNRPPKPTKFEVIEVTGQYTHISSHPTHRARLSRILRGLQQRVLSGEITREERNQLYNEEKNRIETKDIIDAFVDACRNIHGLPDDAIVISAHRDNPEPGVVTVKFRINKRRLGLDSRMDVRDD